MKKKIIIGLLVLGTIIFICGLILLFSKSAENKSSKIEIIDATYMCNNSLEAFYEDTNYTYYFPCVKSDSVYVKLENGNKMLVVDALEDEIVTIGELIDAGLKVYKKEK